MNVRGGAPYFQPGHFPTEPSPGLHSFQTQGFKAQMNYLCNPLLCHEATKKDTQFYIRKTHLPLPSIIPPLTPHYKKKSQPGRGT